SQPELRIVQQPDQPPGQRAQVPAWRHQSGAAIDGVVAGAPIVVGAQGGPAPPPPLGRQSESLIPRWAEIDRAATVQPCQPLLRQVLVELGEWQRLLR